MARVTSTQKLPMVFFSCRAKPRIRATRNRNAGGRRSKVLHRQGGHLDEIAHGRFARVRLPVGVGDEAGRRVERQVRRNIARVEVLGIEGQKTLRALDQVSQQETEDAEAQQRGRVLGPALLDLFLHADHLVGEHFEPPQNRMHEGALSFEHAGHEGAQRLRADEDQPQERSRFVRLQC